jgi:hypothetical protein
VRAREYLKYEHTNLEIASFLRDVAKIDRGYQFKIDKNYVLEAGNVRENDIDAPYRSSLAPRGEALALAMQAKSDY